MPLPEYIKPGLYINNLNIVTATPKYAVPKEIDHLVGIEGTKIVFTMQQYACNFQALSTEARTPNLYIKGVRSCGDDDFNYILQAPGDIAIGCLDLPLGTNTHIYSDNFGGCEWHILSRNQDNVNTVAFLHVYKGTKRTCQYTYDGWNKRARLVSSLTEEVSDKLTELGITSLMNCSFVAYAFIAAGSTTIDTCMLILNSYGMVIGTMQHCENC